MCVLCSGLLFQYMACFLSSFHVNLVNSVPGVCD